MVEVKHYNAPDMGFSFVAGSIDSTTSHIDEVPMIKVHTLYPYLA